MERGQDNSASTASSMSKRQGKDIVILEVSSIGGKQATKVIEPPAAKRKKRNPPSSQVPPSEQTNEPQQQSPSTNESGQPSDPAIPRDGMPIMINSGNTSQLMYLYSSPQPGAGISSSRQDGNDMLIRRLTLRINELENKIVNQRNAHKAKIALLEDKFRRKIISLNDTIDKMKNLPGGKTPASKTYKPPTLASSSSPCECSSRKLSTNPDIFELLKDRFSNCQIKAMVEKKATLIRWDNADLLKAFTLRCISYGAYVYVRDQLKYPLPSMRYLTRWLSKHQKKKEADAPSDKFQSAKKFEFTREESVEQDDLTESIYLDEGEMEYEIRQNEYDALEEDQDGSSAPISVKSNSYEDDPREMSGSTAGDRPSYEADDAMDGDEDSVNNYIVVDSSRTFKWIKEKSDDDEWTVESVASENSAVGQAQVYIIREEDDQDGSEH